MPDLGKHAVFMRLGVNSSATARTGTKTWAGNAREWIPVNPGGNTFFGAQQVLQIPTEHQTRGTKYTMLDRRNHEERSLTTNLWPDHAQLLLEAATEFESSNELPRYHHGGGFWTDGILTAGASAVHGRDIRGILFKTLSFTVDRDAGGPVELSLGGYLNQDIAYTSATPTPTFPTSKPYAQINVFIDIEFADSSGNFTAWTGNDSNIKSVGLNFDNGVEVRSFNPDSDANLDLSWTKAAISLPTLTLDVTYYLENEDLMAYGRSSYIQEARARIMFKRRGADCDTTSTDDLTTTGAQTINVASGGATNLAINDVVLIEDVDNSVQEVVLVTAVDPTGDTFGCTTTIALDGSGSNALKITNGAAQLKVDKMDLNAPFQPADDGNLKVVSSQFNAQLDGSATDLVSVLAANDDAA